MKWGSLGSPVGEAKNRLSSKLYIGKSQVGKPRCNRPALWAYRHGTARYVLTRASLVRNQSHCSHFPTWNVHLTYCQDDKWGKLLVYNHNLSQRERIRSRESCPPKWGKPLYKPSPLAPTCLPLTCPTGHVAPPMYRGNYHLTNCHPGPLRPLALDRAYRSF